MTERSAVTKSDPYESNEYLLRRVCVAGEPKAANLINWLNRDFEKLERSPDWKEPRHKPGFIYAGKSRRTLPTVQSTQRLIKLIAAFAHAGTVLKHCLEKWPDRFFLDDPPPELLAAYRPVNQMLHAYRGEYEIDTHHMLRQPAHDKFLKRLPKHTVDAHIRNSRSLDTDATAGLLLDFAFMNERPFGEQQAVADLIMLIQEQRFHLLRRCNAPARSHRGERQTKNIPSCNRWFLASRIDQKFCCPRCKNRFYENSPEAREDRRLRARKNYPAKKLGIGAFSKPKPKRQKRSTNPSGPVKRSTRA